MGTITQHIDVDEFQFRSGTAFPQYNKADGTNFPVTGLYFDATTEETAYFRRRAFNYGSGDLTILLGWYAASATSGGVSFGVSLAAVTPNTDTGSVEAKSFATETIITDTHLGTTAMRAHDAAGTLTNLDSLSADDWLFVRIARKPADAGDTMTGDMILSMVTLSYSDT